MGNDIEKELKDLILTIKGYNTNPDIVDQEVKTLMITKLEEALLCYGKLIK